MRIATWSHLIRLQLAVLYGLAMVLLPLAHHPKPASGSEVVIVTLDDGSSVEICTSSKGTSGQSHKSTCDACRLTSAPGLVTVGLDHVIGRLIAPLRINSREEQLPRFSIAHALSQPRAPPHRLA